VAHLNFATHELTCKLVFCGPGLSGKTTNLEVIHAKAPPERRGKLCSIATQGDRTLFFDYLPIDLGRSAGGIGSKFQVYTVPGQSYYASTRTLVLQGVDGIVFVADSQADRLEENVASLRELEANCKTLNLDLADVPMVFQWNKQDLPNAVDVETLEARLNPQGRPAFPASAIRGEGVLVTLKALTRLVLQRCESDLKGDRVVEKRSSGRLAALPSPTPPAQPRRTEVLAERTLLEEVSVPGAAASSAAADPGSGTPVVSLGDPSESKAPTRPLSRPRTPSARTSRDGGRPRARPSQVPASSLSSADVDVGVALAEAAEDAVRAGALPAPGVDLEGATVRIGAGDVDVADVADEVAGADMAGPAGIDPALAAAALAPAGACPWSSSSGEPIPPCDPDDPVIGQTVGGCVIRAKLGEGGMGAVYVARHATLGKDVVVKVLKPAYAQNRRRVERFFLEARAAARMEYPNIVQIQDLGTNDRGLHYIVMQFVDGTNLAERVRDQGPHEWREAARIVAAVARALAVLHDAGMVHRDVKAENVVVTRTGDVKLIDFGLVKDLNADLNLTRHGALVGTPVYMAPEVGRVERLDGRADLYSLGLTFYYLLTGRPPFEGCEVHDVIFGRARLQKPETLNPGVTPGVRRVLDRMCARRREERYPDARTLVQDLETLLEGGLPTTRATPLTNDELPWAVTPSKGNKKPSGKAPLVAPNAIPPTIPPAAGVTPASVVVAPLSVGAVSDDLLAVAAAVRQEHDHTRPPLEVQPPARSQPTPQRTPAPGRATPGSTRRPVSERVTPPRTDRPATPAPSPAPVSPSEEAAVSDPARKFGPWLLLEVLDAGGIGVLHRARDTRTGGDVALRLLDGVRRLEAGGVHALTAGAQLDQPNLLAPRAHLCEDGRLGVVYDHPAGTRALEVAPLAAEEVARVARDVALALAHVHERGLVHGGITPASVLVGPAGQGLLADQGLAAVEHGRESRRLRVAARLARAGCLAPECGGDAPRTPAADLYALGAVVVRALTGRPPGSDTSWGLIPDLEAIVRRATERDPARRYPNAGELAADLTRFLDGEPPLARAPAGTAEKLPWTHPSRRPRYALAGAVGVLVAALVVLGSAMRKAALAEEQTRRLETLLQRQGAR